MLRSLVGEQVLGREAQWPQCLDLQDPAAHRVPSEPKGMHPPVTGQPLAALLNLLGIQSCLGGGGPGEPSLPLGPLPVTNGLPCPGIGLLPTGRDCSGQLLGLFGQLAASSEPTSGTSPQSKASGRNHRPGNLLALSPLLQNRPLLPSTLPPLGLSLGPGQGPPQGTTSPLAGLLQSLQGSSLHLRPSCRGWRKVASTPQPSACLETLQQRGLSASPGASPTTWLRLEAHGLGAPSRTAGGSCSHDSAGVGAPPAPTCGLGWGVCVCHSSPPYSCRPQAPPARLVLAVAVS
ncbi:methyl-CpG-binding domain protein 6-like isoform X2 [Grus americana]|uniref:methyl-CpG-binding domain protein 6-like isoform X2 n=1 Tax=Grus americana TaxID=9117 RepID=UPI0024083542|nr:methyl-CpG-binding domain protein 6-like isoform X2 [Grus americana]